MPKVNYLMILVPRNDKKEAMRSLKTSVRAFALAFVVLSSSKVLKGAEPIDIDLTPLTKQYCHIIRFPKRWRVPPYNGVDRDVEYIGGYYQLRAQEGTRVLVAGFTDSHPDLVSFNKYQFDLADPSDMPGSATEEQWRDAPMIPIVRKSTFAVGVSVAQSDPASFNGRQFAKTGEHWAFLPNDADRLSPNQEWLVLQSRSGTIARTDSFATFPGPRNRGKIFLDVYSVLGGTKVLTIQGNYRADPDSWLHASGWVGDRFYILPLGEYLDRCLVCDFQKARAKGPQK